MKVSASLFRIIRRVLYRSGLSCIGAIVGFAVFVAASPGLATETISYTYDALGRLIEIKSAGSVNDGQVAATAYDDAGNRTSYSATGVPVSISISDASITEGGMLSFPVTVVGTHLNDVAVDFATSNGTAEEGSDYTAISNTLTFTASGPQTQYIEVTTIDDSVYEGNETLKVTLSSVVGDGVIVAGLATGTIEENEAEPAVLSVADSSVTEGGSLVFAVTRTGDTAGAVSASYATADATAEAGSDYTGASDTVSFAPGETYQEIAIATLDDGSLEGDETLTLTLTAPTNGASLADDTAIGTIIDNEMPVEISVADATATEGNALSFTVTLTEALASAASVDYATVDGTAVAGSDYSSASGTLTFNAGETSKSVTISTANDSYLESSETLTLLLSNPAGGTSIGDGSATGTIEDGNGDPAVTFSISDVTVNEGGTATFIITKSGFSFSSVSVDYATHDGVAASGSDYNAVSGSLSFSWLEYIKLVTVSTIDDSVEEGVESFSLVLESSTGDSGIEDAAGVATINDNDAPVVSIANTSVSEGDELNFSVSLSKVGSSTITVDYATSGGTADVGGDYTSTSGVLTFNPGETSKTFSVPTIEDSTYEETETVVVSLVGSTGLVTIGGATATGSIIDDDTPASSFSVSDAEAIEGASLTFTVSLSSAMPSSVTVNYSTADNTADAGSDYTATSGTLTFSAGQTSKLVTVTTIDDVEVESIPETFSLVLSNPSDNLALQVPEGTGTIKENDSGIRISNDKVTEGGSLSFTVRRQGSSVGSASVNYATSNVTAFSGSDYQSKSGIINFSDGQSVKTITVLTYDDAVAELDETMRVTLSSATGGAVITDAVGVGTIESDELGFYIEEDLSHNEIGSFWFRVIKVGQATGTSTVDYATSDGTASAGSDYTPKSGTLSFSKVAKSKNVIISISGDSVSEDDETMFLNLSNPSSGYQIIYSPAMGTILDND